MDTLLQDTLTILVKLTWAIGVFFHGNDLIAYNNILIPLLIGIVLAWITKRRRVRDILTFLFPKSVWKAPSARIDLLWYLIVIPLAVFGIAPLLAFMQALSYQMVALLELAFGPHSVPAEQENTPLQIALYTFLVFMAKDFAFFYSHYLSHKWPLLWCFHKVHHTPTALNPFTAARFHPVDLAWNMGWGIALSALMSGICQYFFYNGDKELLLFGNNALIAISYLTTHNLRHSHLWLHYPHRISNWLISPAMHQIHHSAEEKHWDKNFGYLFAGWDRLWKCMYNPHEKEDYQQGVLEDGALCERHNTLKGLLTAPFQDAWVLVKQPSKKEK